MNILTNRPWFKIVTKAFSIHCKINSTVVHLSNDWAKIVFLATNLWFWRVSFILKKGELSLLIACAMECLLEIIIWFDLYLHWFYPLYYSCFSVKWEMLPPLLYLLWNNCYTDCKNIHILGFCALPVKASVWEGDQCFFLFLNCNVSLPFSHTFFLWIVDTDKRMKLIFRMLVDLKYFSIFCRFSYGSYGCSHSRRHQPGLPITLYSSFLLIWKWKLPFIKHWRQFPSPGYGPRFVFSLKQRNKNIPLYLNTVTFGIIYLR